MVDNKDLYCPNNISLEKWRQFMARFLRRNPNSGAAWDIMTGLRGPDSPSERPDMGVEERDRAYRGRRKRKYDTVEIIRHTAFYGALGGCARHHEDTKVTLPPRGQWDHFDRHVARAAQYLGLQVKIEGEE